MLAALQQKPVPRPAQVLPVTDPTAQRRLVFDDLVHAGAFRLPATSANSDNFSHSGGTLAYNPQNDSLFVGTRSRRVAEVKVPDPGAGSAIDQLPFATYLQAFADPADGRMREVAADGATLSGLMVYEEQLYGTGLIYYDANHTQTVSHFSRPLTLSAPGVKGIHRVGAPTPVGFVAGYMAQVPLAWQSRLGGPAVTGQCCVPIISRTSMGPAAFVWDPADLSRGGPVAAAPLVYYNSQHATLGPWEGSNPVYGGTTQVTGIALIRETRTALFFGRNGTGPFCYGNGTSDRSLDNTRGPDGERYCYDPSNSAKGQHAYPYRYQIWAYDLNDLAAVRAGQRDPWDVRPYGVWPFDLPFPEPSTRIGGVAYDADRQRLFLSQLQADRDGFAYRPLIHVFHIQ